MIKTAVDTESIWKYIWNELYKISLKKGITQTDIAKKIWSTPWYVSLLLTWKNTTRNTDRYWAIAEAIPLSRAEFDKIVEDAMDKVLWNRKAEVDPKVAFFSEVGVTDKNKQDAILKMIEAFKDV